MESIELLVTSLFEDGNLIYGVLSDSRGAAEDPRKITIKKTIMKGGIGYQSETHRANQVFHQNMSQEEAKAYVLEILGASMRQGVFFAKDNDWNVRFSRKGKPLIVRKPPSRKDEAVAHNRSKKYLIPEGHPVPYLIELGVMAQDGTVKKNFYDKFKQINRYLEFVEDCLPALGTGKTLRIIDFGCGKSYLTFALYDYFVNQRGMPVQITGLDLKKDVVTHCQALAQSLNFTGLHFEVGDIAGYRSESGADMVISLHACDRATDAALAQAVNWKAKVIMAVPCCHKELIRQISIEGLAPMLEYGILRERIGSMATDTLRALALEVMGYQCQVMEFIDMEHTPKNILIRGIRVREPGGQAIVKYRDFKKTIGVDPGLENDFGIVFKSMINGGKTG